VGQEALGSKLFFVFGTHDTKGAELAGAYKNVIAIASGVLDGKGLGRNIQGMLITRGLREMVYFGKLLGSSSRAFIGTSGIGDLVATATSSSSRNFSFGCRLAKGESVDEILKSTDEEIEGLRTLKIAEELAKSYNIHAPITRILYRVVYENLNIDRAIMDLMRFPYAPDVDFL
jgi:glycerol-3-phosphate dehydrogenase (NAD(P)+)